MFRHVRLSNAFSTVRFSTEGVFVSLCVWSENEGSWNWTSQCAAHTLWRQIQCPRKPVYALRSSTQPRYSVFNLNNTCWPSVLMNRMPDWVCLCVCVQGLFQETECAVHGTAPASTSAQEIWRSSPALTPYLAIRYK